LHWEVKALHAHSKCAHIIFIHLLLRGRMVNHSNPRTLRDTNRRATNITLGEALLREARELEINLSQACEQGLALAVAERRRERWLQENQAAMAAWNAHVEEHGLPLAAYRQF
jgi:antitoxin CcdA